MIYIDDKSKGYNFLINKSTPTCLRFWIMSGLANLQFSKWFPLSYSDWINHIFVIAFNTVGLVCKSSSNRLLNTFSAFVWRIQRSLRWFVLQPKRLRNYSHPKRTSDISTYRWFRQTRDQCTETMRKDKLQYQITQIDKFVPILKILFVIQPLFTKPNPGFPNCKVPMAQPVTTVISLTIWQNGIFKHFNRLVPSLSTRNSLATQQNSQKWTWVLNWCIRTCTT